MVVREEAAAMGGRGSWGRAVEGSQQVLGSAAARVGRWKVVGEVWGRSRRGFGLDLVGGGA